MSFADEIFAAVKVPAKEITPAGFPFVIEVRGMTGEQRADFLDYVKEHRTGEKDAKGNPEVEFDYRTYYPMLAIGYVYRPGTNEAAFTEAHKAHLLQLPGTALEEIGKAVLELSGLDAKAETTSRDGSSEANGGTTTPSPNA